MLKNRKYNKNRKYSKNRPVQPKNRKNRKLSRFLTGWGIFNFFSSQVITLRRFGPFVLKSNPKPKVTQSLISLTFKLRLSSHSRDMPQATSRARLTLSSLCLSQALAMHKSAFCTAALSAQRLRRSLHSCSSALLCTSDSLTLLFT